ncbi:MAG: 50S ribosomal protein L25, partial [Halomonas venusta]|nr:50S ribosomal protein L25 [Halomonas venusta]
FLRVDATHEITINVPLHVVGEDKCVGIKDQGGELHVLANEVAISCLPKDLPDFLEVDISAIELGTTLHLSDLNLPAGVTSVDLAHGEDHDNAVLSITKVKVRGGDDEESNDEEEPSAE